MTSDSTRLMDRRMLDMASRLASRARGDVEPNPLVGCVIGRRRSGSVDVIGCGHHGAFGGDHAEVEAIADCRRRGHDPAGATVWVTLEPCAHEGKTPPCATALIEAQVGDVVIARLDPTPEASGGAEALRRAGVEVRVTDASTNAIRLSDPFAHRVATNRPWVIAKWAQTIDGCIATRSGASKWISNDRSRLDVHRLRSRVDAILTGVGTAVADDPSLTARGVRRVRRVARRIVIDPRMETPLDSKLVRSARDTPLEIWSTTDARRAAYEQAGATVVCGPTDDGRLDLRACLERLAASHDATMVLVEAGPALMGSLLEADLVDEARVYVAPMLLADHEALPPVRGRVADTLADASRFTLADLRRFGDDVRLRYVRRRDSHSG